MQTDTALRASTDAVTCFHPLAPEDAPVVAAMRAAASSHKGEINGPQARIPFDAMIGAAPAAADVKTAPGVVGGVRGWWCRPLAARPNARLLYVHGGGYVLGSARAFCNIVSQIAQRTRTDTFIPEYRLAPEHSFPAALDDVCAAYRGLAEGGPEAVAVAGESAGGGLVLALLSVAAQDTRAMPLPCGAAVISPWTDLALTGASYRDRADADPIFTRGSLGSLAGHYLQGQDATDPRASPLHGPLGGLPPIRIDVGEDEVLLDDSRRYAERARAAGVEVTLSVWAGMAHAFPSSVGKLAAAGQALDAIGTFLSQRLEARSMT
jgi:monoterpene epsilon-lactone hydrolase